MRQIFLSATTGEFRSHRRLLKADLSLPRVKVQEQADLVQGEGKLLQTLDTYIRDYCDTVIHLVGREGEETVKLDEIHWLLETYGDFPTRFPLLALAAALHASPPTLTYTQLEAWLALYHRKRCHLYRPSEILQFDPASLLYLSLGTLFKGREAFLQQLRTSLTKATGKATAVVGKTRLAVEYAWQYRDKYSAVLFVTADSPTNLQRNLAELAGPQALNLPERTAPQSGGRGRGRVPPSPDGGNPLPLPLADWPHASAHTNGLGKLPLSTGGIGVTHRIILNNGCKRQCRSQGR